MLDMQLAAYVKHLVETGNLLSQPIVAAQAIKNDWIVISVDSGWDVTYDVTPIGDIIFEMVAKAEQDKTEIIWDPYHPDYDSRLLPDDRYTVHEGQVVELRQGGFMTKFEAEHYPSVTKPPQS